MIPFKVYLTYFPWMLLSLTFMCEGNLHVSPSTNSFYECQSPREFSAVQFIDIRLASENSGFQQTCFCAMKFSQSGIAKMPTNQSVAIELSILNGVFRLQNFPSTPQFQFPRTWEHGTSVMDESFLLSTEVNSSRFAVNGMIYQVDNQGVTGQDWLRFSLRYSSYFNRDDVMLRCSPAGFPSADSTSTSIVASTTATLFSETPPVMFVPNASSGSPSNSSTPVIAAVAVVLALIAVGVLAIVMVILHRRRQRKQPSTNSLTSVTVNTVAASVAMQASTEQVKSETSVDYPPQCVRVTDPSAEIVQYANVPAKDDQIQNEDSKVEYSEIKPESYAKPGEIHRGDTGVKLTYAELAF